MQKTGGRRRGGRLQFDRRYGWVVDEWRDPSAEALAWGRGMFCILPIFKALVNFASQSVDFTADSVLQALEERGLVNGLKSGQNLVDLNEEASPDIGTFSRARRVTWPR